MTFVYISLIVLIALGVINTLVSNRTIEARWPMIGRLVKAQSVEAHVVEQGSGPDVLLVHGAASNARELIAAFSGRMENVRIIAPDRPGLGYSQVPPESHELKVQADFMADIVRQTAKGPVVAVGHSWGSGVILRLALDHPDLVKALVLVAPASHPWVPTFNLIHRLVAIPLLGDLLVWTMPALVGQSLMPAGIAKGFTPGPVKPANYAQIIGTPLFFRPKSFKANAADMEAGSVQMSLQASRYPSLKLPVAIISGQGDVIVFNSIHAAGLVRDIPHAASYRVTNAGHMPHWVDPDLVTNVIKAYALDTALPISSAQFHTDQVIASGV